MPVITLPSHPTWVRGLKLVRGLAHLFAYRVAPYVGAWIETGYFSGIDTSLLSHPTWVRGLKLEITTHDLLITGRTLRGCVD